MAAGGCGVVHPPSPPCLIQSLQSREVKSGPWVGRYLESGVVLGVVVCQVLLLFFEFDDHDFDGFVAGVYVGVEGVGGHGGKPVGFAGLPVVGFGGAAGFDDVHGAAGEGDDDAGVVVVVHGQGLVGEDEGLPDFYGFVVELRGSEGLGGGFIGLGDEEGGADGGGEESGDEEGAAGDRHGGSGMGGLPMRVVRGLWGCKGFRLGFGGSESLAEGVIERVGREAKERMCNFYC